MWIFGYGSLMWDGWEKEFDGIRHDNSKILNYRRDFNKKSTVNWGTPQNPGPTLGLEIEDGSECVGSAFEFPDEKKKQVLEYLSNREGASFSFPEMDIVLENGNPIKAFTPINSRTSQTYIGSLTFNQKIQMAQNAVGSNGKCVDYVSNIRNKLVELNIHDEYVENFWKALS